MGLKLKTEKELAVIGAILQRDNAEKSAVLAAEKFVENNREFSINKDDIEELIAVLQVSVNTMNQYDAIIDRLEPDEVE
jgi:uncharacterized protein (DUF1778 family)